MQFTITHAFPASDKQQNVGILATFNMSLVGDDGTTYVSLQDLKIVKSKEGKRYIGSPYREYEGKAQGGSGTEKKKIHYIRIFPNKNDWAKQDDIVNAVLTKIGSDNNTPAQKATTTTSKPAPKVSPSTEAW